MRATSEIEGKGELPDSTRVGIEALHLLRFPAYVLIPPCSPLSICLEDKRYLEQKKPLPQKNHNLDSRQLSEKLVKRRCAFQTLPENLPTCECRDPATLWTHPLDVSFLRSGWLDFRRNPSNHVAGKWKIFPVENIHKLSGCRKEHADHFPVENGSNFPVESENFPDTPMETLVMHPANTEDARNGAGQSQTCRVLETPNTLCNRNMSFLLLGFLANFPEYFPEKRVMRNGFFFSEREIWRFERNRVWQVMVQCTVPFSEDDRQRSCTVLRCNCWRTIQVTCLCSLSFAYLCIWCVRLPISPGSTPEGTIRQVAHIAVSFKSPCFSHAVIVTAQCRHTSCRPRLTKRRSTLSQRRPRGQCTLTCHWIQNQECASYNQSPCLWELIADSPPACCQLEDASIANTTSVQLLYRKQQQSLRSQRSCLQLPSNFLDAGSYWSLAVEKSTAVGDAIDDCNLYCIFWFVPDYSTAITRVSLQSTLERGIWELLPASERKRSGLKLPVPVAEGALSQSSGYR